MISVTGIDEDEMFVGKICFEIDSATRLDATKTATFVFTLA